MKTIPLLGIALLVTVTFAACSKPRAAVALKEIKIETLLEKMMADEFMRDREVIVQLVEVPPNTTMDWHSHPGEEFHYYLEGEVELAFDGAPSIQGKPGKVAHVPYKKVHTVITREKGVKLVVFRVHTKGQPVRIPATPPKK
jgi:quercetin dioxygenase-like cupin family protein